MSMQREMPAAVKMLMVSAATRSAMRGGTTTGMVLDSKGERILNGEKSRLKANGVQEGPKGISLLAPSGHVGNELPLAEERRGAAISILKPIVFR